MYRPFVRYQSEDEYKEHFQRVYCNPSSPTVTFDSITIEFRPGQFRHAFYTGRSDQKDAFSFERAFRIDWIGEVLRDANADLYVSWRREERRYDPARRTALVEDIRGHYTVVIQMKDDSSAIFITAYVSEAWNVAKIRSGRRWPIKKGR